MNERSPHSPAPPTRPRSRFDRAAKSPVSSARPRRSSNVGASRVVARRRRRDEPVREVAGGDEEHVASELLGAAAHELPEGAVLAVRADDRERHEALGRAGSSAARGRRGRGWSSSAGERASRRGRLRPGRASRSTKPSRCRTANAACGQPNCRSRRAEPRRDLDDVTRRRVPGVCGETTTTVSGSPTSAVERLHAATVAATAVERVAARSRG